MLCICPSKSNSWLQSRPVGLGKCKCEGNGKQLCCQEEEVYQKWWTGMVLEYPDLRFFLPNSITLSIVSLIIFLIMMQQAANPEASSFNANSGFVSIRKRPAVIANHSGTRIQRDLPWPCRRYSNPSSLMPTYAINATENDQLESDTKGTLTPGRSLPTYLQNNSH